MPTEFPKPQKQYLKASDFQDNPITLTYVAWDRKANEDDPAESKLKRSWKDKLKYCLRYTYPEFAFDPATGEQRKNKNGNPFKNTNYDPEYPHGYTIKYVFEEGELDSGSLPLWDKFCLLRPNPGDLVQILRTGQDKETVWSLKRLDKDGTPAKTFENGDVPEIEVNNDPLDNLELSMNEEDQPSDFEIPPPPGLQKG